jgi:hypothetical protein
MSSDIEGDEEFAALADQIGAELEQAPNTESIPFTCRVLADSVAVGYDGYYSLGCRLIHFYLGKRDVRVYRSCKGSSGLRMCRNMNNHSTLIFYNRQAEVLRIKQMFHVVK